MSKQAFKSWTPETFEQTGETPQDAFRQVELEALGEKYAGDWLLRLFLPLGITEVLESNIRMLMEHLHQSYGSVMSMPCSRRRRILEKLVESLKR